MIFYGVWKISKDDWFLLEDKWWEEFDKTKKTL
jgi:hypothetical protein